MIRTVKNESNSGSGRTEGKRGWFGRFLLCCAAFFLVFGLVSLAYYALGMEPFGSRTVSIDDAKIQYIDFFTYYVDVLHGTRSISYDFANMLGGSSLGLFSYYLASPFNFLLYFFGKEGVYRFFNVAVALKLGTAGATFSWYLQRRFSDRIRPSFVLALSMGYGMMQYSIAQSSNIMWLDGVYMLPLILLGVYEVIHRKSVWRLVLAVGVCILCNWYMAGICCLFSGIWFVFEYFFVDREEEKEAVRGGSGPSLAGADSSGGHQDTMAEGAVMTEGAAQKAAAAGDAARQKAASETAERQAAAAGSAVQPVENRSARDSRRLYNRDDSHRHSPGVLLGITDFVLSFCRYVWGMGLGVALSAVLFLPAVSAMRQGKGQYEKIKVLMEMSGDYLSAVRGYVIGTTSSRGFAALFCGGIALAAAAAMLFSRSLKIRQKIAFLGLGGICFLMLHWEPAMLAFSLLKRADSYWYRYSHLVCFALLFGAAAYLSRAEKDGWLRIFLLLASVLYGAAVLKLNGIHFADFRAQGLALVAAHRAVFMTAASSLLLAVLSCIIFSSEKLVPLRVIAGFLLVAVTGAEMWTNACLFWYRHADDSQTLYREYSEGLQAQLQQLRELDGGTYRIAQDRTRWHYEDGLTAYFNDSLAQNYWSNAAYTSSPENAQLSLMWRLGYRDEAGCMLIVRDPVLASDSFLGVRYLLESAPAAGLEPVEEVDAFNGRTVYRNPYALPMAFVYDGEKLPTRHYENTFAYQNALFSTLSGRKTELYRPLAWTRSNEGDKSYFRIYIPEGDYLAYGNLLWPEKMSGLLSINGAEPFGYCRWMSPAAFLIRSREEQAQSQTDESLQAIAAGKKKEKEMLRAGTAGGDGIQTGIVNSLPADPGRETAEEEPVSAVEAFLNLLLETGGTEAEAAEASDSANADAVAYADAAAGADDVVTADAVTGVDTADSVNDTADGSDAAITGADPADRADAVAKGDAAANADAAAGAGTGVSGTSGAVAPGEEAGAAQGAPEESALQIRMRELSAAAAAFDAKAAASAPESGYADVRTLVFSTEKGLTFKDYQFYALDLNALSEASNLIRTGEVEDVKIENGHVTCSLTGRRGSSLCLLVPWSKGWQAYRNGEEVQPDTVAGTMITIPLVNGENKIELTYHIPYLREGMYISAAAFAVMLLDALCRLLAARKRRKEQEKALQ